MEPEPPVFGVLEPKPSKCDGYATLSKLFGTGAATLPTVTILLRKKSNALLKKVKQTVPVPVNLRNTST